MDVQRLATARIIRFLEREPVLWLSTVRPDGGPHVVPVWFWWDGTAIVVFSKREAQKVRNLQANPSVMLALGDADDDFDVGLIQGRAELSLLQAGTRPPEPFLAKYEARMAALKLSVDDFATTYAQRIRIVPDRFLGWHGRTTPHSARIIGAPHAPIYEPRRRVLHGEPIGA